MLPSAEYYLLGLGHPIMQTYYNLLVNVATLLGGDKTRAKREMKELIEFEIELASVRTCSKFSVLFQNLSNTHVTFHFWKLFNRKTVPTVISVILTTGIIFLFY